MQILGLLGEHLLVLLEHGVLSDSRSLLLFYVDVSLIDHLSLTQRLVRVLNFRRQNTYLQYLDLQLLSN